MTLEDVAEDAGGTLVGKGELLLMAKGEVEVGIAKGEFEVAPLIADPEKGKGLVLPGDWAANGDPVAAV